MLVHLLMFLWLINRNLRADKWGFIWSQNRLLALDPCESSSSYLSCLTQNGKQLLQEILPWFRLLPGMLAFFKPLSLVLIGLQHCIHRFSKRLTNPGFLDPLTGQHTQKYIGTSPVFLYFDQRQPQTAHPQRSGTYTEYRRRTVFILAGPTDRRCCVADGKRSRTWAIHLSSHPDRWKMLHPAKHYRLVKWLPGQALLRR